MQIGTMFFGRVEPIKGQCIETKFFVLGVPLFPLESVYVLDERSRQGIVMRDLSGTSVLAGYLRVYAGLGMLLAGVFAYLDIGGPGWAFALILGLIWIWSMMFLGKLSKRERDQRDVLALLTGLGAPPEHLPQAVRENTSDALAVSWKRLRAEDGFENDDWTLQRGNNSLPMDLRLLLFALERYLGNEWEPIWDSIEEHNVA